MAFTLFGEKKKQQYLVFALAAIISVALLFLAYRFLIKKEPTEDIGGVKKPKEVVINFGFLDGNELDSLWPFERIPAIQEAIGKANPFISY